MTYAVGGPCVDLKDKACVELFRRLHLRGRPDALHPPRSRRCMTAAPAARVPGEAISTRRRPEQRPDRPTARVLRRPGSPAHGQARPDRTRTRRSCSRCPSRTRRGLDAARPPSVPVYQSASLRRCPSSRRTGSRARPRRPRAPGRIVDLSVGTPSTRAPRSYASTRSAEASDSSAVPLRRHPGSARCGDRHGRARLGVTVEPGAVLPTVGSEELVGWLPTLLGLGPADTALVPALGRTHVRRGRAHRRVPGPSSPTPRPRSGRPEGSGVGDSPSTRPEGAARRDLAEGRRLGAGARRRGPVSDHA